MSRLKIESLLQAIDDSARQYLDYDEQGNITDKSIDKYFNYIPRIASTIERGEKEPHLKDLYYIRGILRNRLPYLNEWQCLEILKTAVSSGIPIKLLYMIAKDPRVSSWTKFKNLIYELMEECQ